MNKSVRCDSINGQGLRGRVFCGTGAPSIISRAYPARGLRAQRDREPRLPTAHPTADGPDRQVRGGAMLVITEDSTPAEITEAISHLRAKQRMAEVQQVRDELEDDINALLDRLPRKAGL